MAIDSTSDGRQAKRLESLDILRGLDLFLLVFLQPVLVSVLSRIDSPAAAWLLFQLDHEMWEGFRFWDIIMPLFLFMAGAAMPFSFSKYRNGAKSKVYWRVFRRCVLLFLIGMVVQGNLLAFDPEHIYIYTNTLQAIAAGYLIGAVILLHCNLRWQIIATVVLLAAYSLPMSLWGDFSPKGNIANVIDEAVLGRFRGDPTYTWVFTSLVFGVTVMLGAFAGQIMKSAGTARVRAAGRLAVIGLALVLTAWLWSYETPVVKRIWSGSMTLLSGGYCFLLMALFYYLIDCRGWLGWLGWLKIYGMNAITAYVLGEVINFRSIVQSVSFGLQPYLGDFYPCWLTFGNFLVLYFILLVMYRNKVFVKL